MKAMLIILGVLSVLFAHAANTPSLACSSPDVAIADTCCPVDQGNDRPSTSENRGQSDDSETGNCADCPFCKIASSFSIAPSAPDAGLAFHRGGDSLATCQTLESDTHLFPLITPPRA